MEPQRLSVGAFKMAATSCSACVSLQHYPTSLCFFNVKLPLHNISEGNSVLFTSLYLYFLDIC